VWEFAELDMARPLQDDLPLGERIAYWRRRRGMSQRVCAELVGRTEGWLSQIERGIRPLDRLSVLVELARVLRVDSGELTGAAIRQLAPNGHDHPAVAAIRSALMRYDTVAGVAPPPGTQQPRLRDLESLRMDAERAWALRQAARYDELGGLLPRLLTEVQLAVQRASDADAQASLGGP
jgi:transcriptional regulator with XRE-family HTH domain